VVWALVEPLLSGLPGGVSLCLVSVLVVVLCSELLLVDEGVLLLDAAAGGAAC